VPILVVTVPSFFSLGCPLKSSKAIKYVVQLGILPSIYIYIYIYIYIILLYINSLFLFLFLIFLEFFLFYFLAAK
jgi:hypothetical protein